MTDRASIFDQHIPNDLVAEIASLSSRAVSADFLVLVEALKLRFGSSLEAVLLYGSCLRSDDLGDGVVDFYVIVNSYSKAYPERYLGYLNAWLAPNVFYLEVSAQEHTPERKFRAKYAVVSMADFEQGTWRWFHPYLWARFAQPSRLLYARDETVRKCIYNALAHAVVTFLKSSLPMLNSSVVNVEAIWINGLTQTYAAELRPERATRAQQLVQINLDDYTRLTEHAAPALVEMLEVLPDGGYRCLIDAADGRRARWRWRLRRWQGTVLSVLRLTKAAFTFSDSISYAAWKIERHTGVRVEVTPMLRRHPVLWGFKVSWQLLRRGVIR
jgi:predicted nucleotidyltransferase